MSNDGRQLAYASGGRDQAQAMILTVGDKEPAAQWNLPGAFESLAGSASGSFTLVREERTGEGRKLHSVVYDVTVDQRELRPRKILRRPMQTDQSGYLKGSMTPDGRVRRLDLAGKTQPFDTDLGIPQAVSKRYFTILSEDRLVPRPLIAAWTLNAFLGTG